MSCPGYAVDVTCNDVVADVLVNDWLAYRAHTDPRRVAEQKINAFVFEGNNEIRVVLRRSPTAREGHKPEFELRLLRADHGDQENPPELLLHFCWDAELLPLEDDAPVEVFRHDWSLARGFGRWGWQDAVPYMPPDRPAIEALVTEAHKALARHDLDAYAGLNAHKAEELARSKRLPMSEIVGDLRAFFGTLMNMDGFIVWPVDVHELELTSSAGGRLVQVTRPDGSAPLRVQVDDFVMDVDLLVSRIGRAWTIVR